MIDTRPWSPLRTRPKTDEEKEATLAEFREFIGEEIPCEHDWSSHEDPVTGQRFKICRRCEALIDPWPPDEEEIHDDSAAMEAEQAAHSHDISPTR